MVKGRKRKERKGMGGKGMEGNSLRNDANWI